MSILKKYTSLWRGKDRCNKPDSYIFPIGETMAFNLPDGYTAKIGEVFTDNWSGEAAGGTCTYSVEGIELEPFVCVTFDEDTPDIGFLLSILTPDTGGGLILTNASGSGISLADMLTQIEGNTSINNTADRFFSLEVTDNGFCYRVTGNVDALFELEISGVNIDSEERQLGDGWSISGNLQLVSDTPIGGALFQGSFPYTFQVNINGTWTTQTPVNGTWSLTTTDTVTEWRIIDANENVVQEPQPVQVSCPTGKGCFPFTLYKNFSPADLVASSNGLITGVRRDNPNEIVNGVLSFPFPTQDLANAFQQGFNSGDLLDLVTELNNTATRYIIPANGQYTFNAVFGIGVLFEDTPPSDAEASGTARIAIYDSTDTLKDSQDVAINIQVISNPFQPFNITGTFNAVAGDYVQVEIVNMDVDFTSGPPYVVIAGFNQQLAAMSFNMNLVTLDEPLLLPVQDLGTACIQEYKCQDILRIDWKLPCEEELNTIFVKGGILDQPQIQADAVDAIAPNGLPVPVYTRNLQSIQVRIAPTTRDVHRLLSYVFSLPKVFVNGEEYNRNEGANYEIGETLRPIGSMDLVYDADIIRSCCTIEE